MPGAAGDVTQILIACGEGDRVALDALLPLVYDELRRIAASYLAGERRGHTLQPTALVHEAYMRLVDQRSADWHNRAQFFGLAAQMMRRILVNHAMARRAEKRGGDVQRVPLDDADAAAPDGRGLDVLALDATLAELARLDEEKARLVEMKFFGGMTIREIAKVTGKSTATVEREWAFARGWLYKTLAEEK